MGDKTAGRWEGSHGDPCRAGEGSRPFSMKGIRTLSTLLVTDGLQRGPMESPPPCRTSPALREEVGPLPAPPSLGCPALAEGLRPTQGGGLNHPGHALEAWQPRSPSWELLWPRDRAAPSHCGHPGPPGHREPRVRIVRKSTLWFQPLRWGWFATQ